jgi:hypothetical protein
MTYIYETVIGTKKLVVEYCYSSVDNCIKVVEMTADGKFHRFNWMNEVGQKKLMDSLEKDMTDRMCRTGDYSTDIDLDRDVPGFDGTMDELDHLVNIGAV